MLSGIARDNQVLSVTSGSWSGTAPLTFSRQWLRCDTGGSACAPIAGVTGATYRLTPSDVGQTVRARVTVTNAAASVEALSNQTGIVHPDPPVNSTVPTISGLARDGQTLASTLGAWTGTPTVALTRQWRRCDNTGAACQDIPGANGASYPITPDDVGFTIRLRVMGSNAAGDATADSAPSGLVQAVAPSATSAPSIPGTARDGQTLTASDRRVDGHAVHHLRHPVAPLRQHRQLMRGHRRA